MGYTALYRKFRPLTFSEMVGQEHITRTLRNQIISNRVGHAYLFNGGRGTGKTTSAKVLARAINCLNPKDGEPCNECEICKAALNGSLTDIVEMDGPDSFVGRLASNLQGCTDTTIYVLALYFGSIKVTKTRHALSAGLFADFVGIVAAFVITMLFFG